uniref:Divalent-cation tolerance protein CutA n=1 Tax=Arcella intermedia TaxID=1963864 RepID=A0A6B2LU25_9EUKA
MERKLVACVNLIPGIQSMFWWEGKICNEQEILLMLKTETSLMGEVIKVVKSSHTYSVPEIISIPLGEGNPDYYKWIADSVQNSEKSAL